MCFCILVFMLCILSAFNWLVATEGMLRLIASVKLFLTTTE
jgi:hypothetical protein